MNEKNRKASQAYHEAGHAVIAIRLGYKFEKISLKNVSTIPPLGLHFNEHGPSFVELGKEVMIYYAGIEAEKRKSSDVVLILDDAVIANGLVADILGDDKKRILETVDESIKAVNYEFDDEKTWATLEEIVLILLEDKEVAYDDAVELYYKKQR